jgi:hypothetical protein
MNIFDKGKQKKRAEKNLRLIYGREEIGIVMFWEASSQEEMVWEKMNYARNVRKDYIPTQCDKTY